MPTLSESHEPGAPAVAGGIPLCVPHLGGNERRYVDECLDTNFVSSVGPFVGRFEQEFAEYLGGGHAVAVVNGTAALHVALLIAGVRPDDEVLVSALSFIAPANAIRYAGAWPAFIDAEPEYWEMDPRRVRDFLEKECERRAGEVRNRRTGRRVSAILPVHILGHPVDMGAVNELTREYGLAVIEDATESLGASYRGRPAGRLGDIACFSFNGNKLLTTGGGGIVFTADESLAKRARYLSTQAKDDPLEYVHGAVGFNYRLTNIQAALGCAQLERIEAHLEAKRRIAAEYNAGLAEIAGLTPMRQAPWAESAWWMYTVLVDADAFGMDSRALLRYLANENIQARPLWQPLHRSPAHAGTGVAAACPLADRLAEQALSLPCSVGLTVEEQQRVIGCIRDAGAAH